MRTKNDDGINKSNLAVNQRLETLPWKLTQKENTKRKISLLQFYPSEFST